MIKTKKDIAPIVALTYCWFSGIGFIVVIIACTFDLDSTVALGAFGVIVTFGGYATFGKPANILAQSKLIRTQEHP